MLLCPPILLGAALAADMSVQVGAPLEEYQSKAKFLAFVTYYTVFPTKPPPDQPWSVGILGRSPFGKYLGETFNPSLTIRARPVRLSFPQTQGEAVACDVLFISKSEQGRLEDLLDWVRGRPILTIGDTRGFAQRGVMVNFVLEEGFIKTEVNLQAARKAGLDFSSAFLRTSRIVRPD